MPDFVLYRAEPASVAGAAGDEAGAQHPAADAARVPLDGPALVLAEGGSLRLLGRLGESRLDRGEAVYVTPDEGAVEITGDGIAWVATTGPLEASAD